MIPSAPKFRKVELLIKDETTKPTTITKIKHDDCAMIITGDYVIITEDEGNNEIDAEHRINGKIYQLQEIDSYRLYKD